MVSTFPDERASFLLSAHWSRQSISAMNRPLVRYILPVFLGSACVMLTKKIRQGKKDLPNILLFTIDSQGWQDTSVPFLTQDGNPVATPLNGFYNTPGMEQLALHGVRMSHAYGAADALGGLESLLTGMDPARHGMFAQENEIALPSMCAPSQQALRGKASTLAHLMQQGGYRTIVSGSLPQGIGKPGRDGFDVHCHADDEAALHEEIGKAVHEGEPFFACVRRRIHPIQGQGSNRHATVPDLGDNVQVDEDELRSYAEGVEVMDASLGALLQCLEDLGVAGRTLVLFVPLSGGDAPIQKSQAGNVAWVEMVGATSPLRGRQCSRYEGGGRIPMIVAWAETSPREACQQALPITPNSVQNAIVSVQDILPTLVSLTGVKTPRLVDGYDIADYLGGAEKGKRPQWIVRHFPFSHPYGRFYSSLRIQDWKVIYNYFDDYAETGNATWQLFNLKDDPSESNNLATTPSGAKLLFVMASKLVDYLDSIHASYPRLTDPESPRINGCRQVMGMAVIRLPRIVGE